MTPFENPEQLRLAAKILETGCKWQYRLGLSDWRESQNVNPANCLHSGYEIRVAPIELLQPPDGLVLHNPNNLTGDQVGEGYRLLCVGEPTNVTQSDQEQWEYGRWIKSGRIYNPVIDALTHASNYRVPASVPWPTVDKWTKEKAAFAEGKVIQFADPRFPEDWMDWMTEWDAPDWSRRLWRIKPEPKLVQLTAEDVPIGSVIRPEAWLIGFVNYEAVVTNGIRMIVDAWGYDGNIGYISWEQLMNDGWLINRNDGKGWLPCSKEVAE